MDETEYKLAIKEARRLGNQIQYRADVIEKAQAEIEVMAEARAKLIRKVKEYEEAQA